MRKWADAFAAVRRDDTTDTIDETQPNTGFVDYVNCVVPEPSLENDPEVGLPTPLPPPAEQKRGGTLVGREPAPQPCFYLQASKQRPPSFWTPDGIHERRGRPVQLALPQIRSATDLIQALGVLTEAVGAAALSPEEARAIGDLLEMNRKAIETADLEERIAALEARTGEGNL